MTAADVRQAILRLYKAAAEASAIAELPAEIGARVRWSNGVVWERRGEDRWQAIAWGEQLLDWQPHEKDGDAYSAPSRHVASGTIVEVVPA